MAWLKRHLGDWISLQAHADRVPPRLTIVITLGELPEGWQRPRARARTWIGLVGVVCIAPFIVLVAAALLRGVGVTALYDWISGSSVAILGATISLFIGIPVAIVLNLWRIVRVGLRRGSGAIDGLVALEFAPLHLFVVLAAGLIGVMFVGHLAADSYACFNGVRTAC